MRFCPVALLAAEHGVVRAFLVDPRAKAGRESAMSQLAFGGSLFASSGHRSSISSRIGSETASMCLKSRTSLWMRSISAEWMIRPSKTRELVAGFFLGHCGRSCAGWGNGPSCSNTHARSRQSIHPPQAGQRMKCSASLAGGSPRRLPMYLPRGMSVIQFRCSLAGRTGGGHTGQYGHL